MKHTRLDGTTIETSLPRLSPGQLYEAAKLLGGGDSLGFLLLVSGLTRSEFDALDDASAAEIAKAANTETFPRIIQLASADPNLLALVYPYLERTAWISNQFSDALEAATGPGGASRPGFARRALEKVASLTKPKAKKDHP